MHTLPKSAALALLTLTFPAAVMADGAFYGDPPDESHPWTVHDPNRF
jgi:hypothetical protein